MLGCGMGVVDLGVVSTPALFRESRTRKLPAVMVTASHNEPEYNGLKFIINGKGIAKDAFDRVLGGGEGGKAVVREGFVRRLRKTSYTDDLLSRCGEGSCEGVKVALDLGGGAAIFHAFPLLRRLGCTVTSMNDTPGVFSRRIDPTADELTLLRSLVTTKGCDIGLAFDCDGDRLVIVDDRGRKRTGDFMLTLAIAQLLPHSGETKVVVSVDTTQAIDMVAESSKAAVVRTKVGEANVVGGMVANKAKLGGEGSSGGLIDGSFNYCRDSMLAALTIIKALRESGRRVYGEVPVFIQRRLALQLPSSKAQRAMRSIASSALHADTTDGVKLWPTKRSWVLIRASGTEDVVRVSVEAETEAKASELVEEYASRLKELSK
jgi:phosphomannomutase